MIFVSESCMVLYCCCQYQRRQYQQSINVVSIGEVTMFVSESCMVLYCCCQYQRRQYQQSINVVSIGEVTMFVSESCMVLYCCRQYHCRQYQCHHQYQLLYIFGAVLLVSVSWSSSISRSLPVLTIRSNND